MLVLILERPRGSIRSFDVTEQNSDASGGHTESPRRCLVSVFTGGLAPAWEHHVLVFVCVGHRNAMKISQNTRAVGATKSATLSGSTKTVPAQPLLGVVTNRRRSNRDLRSNPYDRLPVESDQ